MKKNTVITISRQYGSGGRQIGQQVAQKLGIPFYDKELITMAAKESGFSEEIFKNADETATSSLLYTLSSLGAGAFNMPLNDKVFIIQSEIIRKAAAQGSCVIVGRCADYVLRNQENCVNIFIHSALPHRVKRAVEEYGLKADNAQELVLKTDKRRATYYNYYSSLKWGKVDNYHLALDSDSIGIAASVDLIVDYIEHFNEK